MFLLVAPRKIEDAKFLFISFSLFLYPQNTPTATATSKTHTQTRLLLLRSYRLFLILCLSIVDKIYKYIRLHNCCSCYRGSSSVAVTYSSVILYCFTSSICTHTLSLSLTHTLSHTYTYQDRRRKETTIEKSIRIFELN